jgi:hypothetical protein
MNRSTPSVRQPHRRHPLVAALAAFALLPVLAACGPAGASPSPTPAPTVRPTPTPITAKVATPEDAATLVIATDPLFSGAIQLQPDLIGASKYWEATPLAGGGYEIKLTLGWGDCPAGCIDRHIWTFRVTPDGQVELVKEEGPEVPSDLPA